MWSPTSRAQDITRSDLLYREIICNDETSARRIGESWRLRREHGYIYQAATEIVARNCFNITDGFVQVIPVRYVSTWTHGISSLTLIYAEFSFEGRRVFFFTFRLGTNT